MTMSDNTAPSKGIIISANSLLPWTLQQALVTGYAANGICLDTQINMVKELITSLHECDYKVVLTYGATYSDQNIKTIGDKLGADGIIQSPLLSGQGSYRTIAEDFNIDPSLAICVTAGPEGYGVAKKDITHVATVKPSDVINSMLPENTVYMSKRAVEGVIKCVGDFINKCDSDPTVKQKFPEIYCPGD